MNNIVKEVADLILENEKLKAALQIQAVKEEMTEELKEGENAILISKNQYNLFKRSLLEMVKYDYYFNRLDTGYGNNISNLEKWKKDAIEKSKLPTNVSFDFVMNMIDALLTEQYYKLVKEKEKEELETVEEVIE